MAQLMDMLFGTWTRVGPRKHVLGGVHTGDTCRLPLNCPCVVVIWPFLSYYFGHLLLLGHIAVLLDAAYCYRWGSVVCLSVCHDHEPCKNG